MKDYRGAIADYDKAIQLESNYLTAYHNRADAKFELKDYQGSIVDYSNVISKKPNYAITYIKRANAKLKLSLKESACLDFSKAGELGEESAYELINKYCN